MCLKFSFKTSCFDSFNVRKNASLTEVTVPSGKISTRKSTWLIAFKIEDISAARSSISCWAILICSITRRNSFSRLANSSDFWRVSLSNCRVRALILTASSVAAIDPATCSANSNSCFSNFLNAAIS